MKERIKQLRKCCGVTQQEFADRLGISRSNVATYETGKSNLGEAVIALICREFNVNDEWLRNGTGEMFNPERKESDLLDWAKDVLSDESDSFQHRFIEMLSRLNPDEWKMLEKMGAMLAEGRQKPKKEEPWEREARLLEEEAAALRKGGRKCSDLPPAKDA